MSYSYSIKSNVRQASQTLNVERNSSIKDETKSNVNDVLTCNDCTEPEKEQVNTSSASEIENQFISTTKENVPDFKFLSTLSEMNNNECLELIEFWKNYHAPNFPEFELGLSSISKCAIPKPNSSDFEASKGFTCFTEKNAKPKLDGQNVLEENIFFTSQVEDNYFINADNLKDKRSIPITDSLQSNLCNPCCIISDSVQDMKISIDQNKDFNSVGDLKSVKKSDAVVSSDMSQSPGSVSYLDAPILDLNMDSSPKLSESNKCYAANCSFEPNHFKGSMVNSLDNNFEGHNTNMELDSSRTATHDVSMKLQTSADVLQDRKEHNENKPCISRGFALTSALREVHDVNFDVKDKSTLTKDSARTEENFTNSTEESTNSISQDGDFQVQISVKNDLLNFGQDIKKRKDRDHNLREFSDSVKVEEGLNSVYEGEDSSMHREINKQNEPGLHVDRKEIRSNDSNRLKNNISPSAPERDNDPKSGDENLTNKDQDDSIIHCPSPNIFFLKHDNQPHAEDGKYNEANFLTDQLRDVFKNKLQRMLRNNDYVSVLEECYNAIMANTFTALAYEYMGKANTLLDRLEYALYCFRKAQLLNPKTREYEDDVMSVERLIGLRDLIQKMENSLMQYYERNSKLSSEIYFLKELAFRSN